MANRSALTLRARLLVAFSLPALLVLAAGGALLYRFSRQVLEVQLGEALMRTAAVVAAQLKPERILALTPEDASGDGSRTYRSVRAQLELAQKAGDLRRVMVFDAQRRARVDVGGGLPPMAEVPELLRDVAEVDAVFREQQPHASQVMFFGTDDRWYKTGYAPVLDEHGTVVAAVAVEGGAAFFEPLRTLRDAFIALAVVMLLLLAVAAVISAQTLSAPLERLVASALRIGGGDFTTPVAAQPTHEIGVLARELEAMRVAIDSRDRQLKMMLGGVAHEVKNPLGGIELFAGLLDEELRANSPSLAEAQQYVSKVRRELDYLKRIVEDFLSFAKDQKLNRASFDAEAWIRDASQHLAGEAASCQVTLSVSAEPRVLSGDESLLTGALVNLIKNAVQASPPNRPVTVTGRISESMYVIEVHDQGNGIARDVLPNIFEPFFTTREKGTGLGLPLAKKLVEAHRGQLSVTSEPGNTRFQLRLPMGS
jgi:signal transduction histidine kinase